MSWLRTITWLLSGAIGAIAMQAAEIAPPEFARDVLPILRRSCFECHGAEKQKSGYRLDVRDHALKGGDSASPAIVPHDAAKSPLFRYVSGVDEEMLMPPKKSRKPRLTDVELQSLRSWIDAGAPWPDAEAGTTERFDLGTRKERLPWIWQPPRKQPIPDEPGATDVDRFIRARLREKELAPAPPADDLTWLRRVHFAITGLPPTHTEMRSFLEEPEATRRIRAVDALLASPRFGERWARHWMDLVRYAESRGHEEDYSIANAWQYRDYLIRAFNADIPYDRFASEHIAGDLLPPRLSDAGANESVLATGWAFLGEEVHSPVDIRQDECDRVDNKVDVLSKTFLGLTISCARCHDHKFDAITQKDYYAMCGFVLSSPYRQVRFETMQAHSQAAAQLAGLRSKSTGNVASALASSLRPHLDGIVPLLLGARRVALGESAEAVSASTGVPAAELTAWAGHLQQANAAASHPLNVLAALLRDPDAEKPDRFRQLLAQFRKPTPGLPADARVVADFTRPGVTPWKSDGPVFGLRPVSAGELTMGTPERPIARVMTYGAAIRDAFWNRLTLAPGTEMDSGALGAADRAGKTLITPTFTLGPGRLHYLVRGRTRVYAAADSHLMIAGPLHGGLVANFDTGAEVRWMTHDLSAYAGHRLHIEFAPQGDSDLEVLMVIESATSPQWLPGAPWQPPSSTQSLRDVVVSFRDQLTGTVEALASGSSRIDERLAPVGNWLVQNPALLGPVRAEYLSAAAECFRAQGDLAKGLRWDSHTAAAWTDGTGVDEHVLIRGKPGRIGELAPRGLPEAFGLPRISVGDTSGRAELARQIASPTNPLFTRVIVNRVWHHLFGRGLVPTVDNFGYLGDRPSHPELLDHLAWQFIHEDQWSLKRLIKRLVLSDTFAMNSQSVDQRAREVDPTNALLHRMSVRRLEGEAIRDAILAISGRLDSAMYGPPTPVNLTDFVVGRGRPANGPLDGNGRRSIYTAVRRNFVPTMMAAFDRPTPFSTVGRRNVTNVPAQSLVMMNDPFIHEQARIWAARLLHELPTNDDGARITRAFETAITRPPTAQELDSTLESLSELRALNAGKPDSIVWSEFCHAMLNTNDFIYVK